MKHPVRNGKWQSSHEKPKAVHISYLWMKNGMPERETPVIFYLKKDKDMTMSAFFKKSAKTSGGKGKHKGQQPDSQSSREYQ